MLVTSTLLVSPTVVAAQVARANAPSEVTGAIFTRAFAGIALPLQVRDSARAIINVTTTEMFAYNGAVPTDSVKQAVRAIVARRDSLLRALVRDSLSRAKLEANLATMR